MTNGRCSVCGRMFRLRWVDMREVVNMHTVPRSDEHPQPAWSRAVCMGSYRRPALDDAEQP